MDAADSSDKHRQELVRRDKRQDNSDSSDAENKGNDAQDSVLVGCRESPDTVGRDADCLEFEDSVE